MRLRKAFCLAFCGLGLFFVFYTNLRPQAAPGPTLHARRVRASAPPGIVSLSKHPQAPVNPEAAARVAEEFDQAFSRCPGLHQPIRPPRPEGRPHYRLVITILSARQNVARRMTARSTWLTSLKDDPSVLYRFVLGPCDASVENDCTMVEDDLRAEARQWGDMIWMPVRERYDLLTYKVFAMISWAGHGGQRSAWTHVRRVLPADVLHEVDGSSMQEIAPFTFDYLFKTDDDILVRADMLLWLLGQHDPSQNLLMGYMFSGNKIHRDPSLKHHEPDFKDCGEIYHPYAAGGGYTLSWPVVRFIANSQSRPRFLRNEDTAVGLWAMPLDLKRVHFEGILLWTGRPCWHDALLQHADSEQAIRACWNELKEHVHPQRTIDVCRSG